MHVSPHAWSPARPESLVVCCSDGRFHVHVEEFILATVGVRADLYAVPGGPAVLDWWSSSLEEERAAETAIRFLADKHHLSAIWLVSHEGCAAYAARNPSLGADEILARQRTDLEKARAKIRGWYPHVDVQCRLVRMQGARIEFEEVGG